MPKTIDERLRALREELHSSFTAMREQAWVTQLYREFDTICFQRSLRLRKPVIALADGETRWGTWDRQAREIRISRNLILKHSWDFVIRILEHEVAHLIADDLLGGDPGHGPVYQQACEILGMPAEYRSATIEAADKLPHWREHKSEGEDRVLARVEKLLALAESANEHEACAAMLRVQDLLRKYNIDLQRRRATSDYVRLTINHHKRRVERTQSLICGILTGHYFVEVIFAELFDPQSLEMHKTIELLGSRQNVLMAEYVYHFLLSRVDTLWRTYQRETMASAKAKVSYQVGLLEGFRGKLESSQSHSPANREEGALLKRSDSELRAFVHTQYPRLSRRSASGATLDANTYLAGVSEGKNIVIHKGMREQQGNRKLLLRD